MLRFGVLNDAATTDPATIVAEIERNGVLNTAPSPAAPAIVRVGKLNAAWSVPPVISVALIVLRGLVKLAANVGVNVALRVLSNNGIPVVLIHGAYPVIDSDPTPGGGWNINSVGAYPWSVRPEALG
jgi:hypothetical protein